MIAFERIILPTPSMDYEEVELGGGGGISIRGWKGNDSQKIITGLYSTTTWDLKFLSTICNVSNVSMLDYLKKVFSEMDRMNKSDQYIIENLLDLIIIIRWIEKNIDV